MEKISESELMAYLYGECSAKDASRIEQALKEDANLMQEYQQLKLLRKTLGKIENKEVVEPEVHFGRNQIHLNTIRRGGSSFWMGWQWIGIAASIVLILMAGYFSKADLSIENGQFRLSFGETMNSESLSAEFKKELEKRDAQIALLMQSDVQNRLASLENSVGNYDESLEERLEQLKALYLKEMNQAISRRLENDQTLQQFITRLEQSNAQSLNSMMEVAGMEQQQSLVSLLNEFSSLLEDQRQQDLLEIQNGINAIARETQLLQMETVQALANLGAAPASRTSLK